MTAGGNDRVRPAFLGWAALLLSTSALTPLFSDLSWLPAVFAVTVAVAIAGVGLRAAGAPLPAVTAVQALVVAIAATVLFTRTGTLGFLPGPSAIADIRALLDGAGQQIRSERVPVDVSAQLNVLVVLSVGAAAVVVDILVVGFAAPAGAGLVLLTMVAVPASLLNGPLPWWSFVLGALALILLLLADGDLRTARAGPAAGVTGLRSPAVLGVVAGSVIVGMFGGLGALGVGTEGRLTASGGGGGVGLNPFTQLRGQLDQPEITPLFTVKGMDSPRYLRSLSLDTYVANRGWVVDQVAADQPLTSSLDNGGLPGDSIDIQVEPLAYNDRWLPTPGTPVDVRGPTVRDYDYDAALETLFTDEARPLPSYGLRSVVPSASADTLREAGTPDISEAGSVDQRFYSTAEIDPEITRITEEVIPEGTDDLDAAVILTDYFRDASNGFVYDIETAGDDSGADSDALVDFLTVGKTGFCEQYASAMATMLRTLGMPARVAVGFTAGNGDETSRRITTEDAHAWVEVYFNGIGWVQFDPTPLTDDRGVVPEYVTQAQEQRAAGTPETTAPEVPTAPGAAPEAAPQPEATEQDPGADTVAEESASETSPVPGRVLLVSAVLGVAAALLALPAGVRSARRRRRVRDGGASAVWDEILDLLGDHGVALRPSETPRHTAERVAVHHGLDEDAADAFHRVVDRVEATWYAAGEHRTVTLVGNRSTDDIMSIARALDNAAPMGLRHRLLPPSLRHGIGASELDAETGR